MKLTTYLIVILLALSCNKDNVPDTNLTYEVIIPNNTKVSIRYYSDYYFETNNLKSIDYDSNEYASKYWYAKRIAKPTEDWFIEAKYETNDTNIKNTEFEISIYANDTLYKTIKGQKILQLKK